MRLVAALLACSLYISPSAFSTTNPIPADYITIQEDVYASVAGDASLVGPGEYRESIGFPSKAMVVKGSGSADGSVVSFPNAEEHNNFILANSGNGNACRGVFVRGSAPEFDYNVIAGNEPDQINGVGIVYDNGGDATIYNAIASLSFDTVSADTQCRSAGGLFYYQTPDYSQIYNMSSGFDAEISDDIPLPWAGYRVKEITLWVGQWFSSGVGTWYDPEGVRINFYHESGPPEMDPFSTVEEAWEDLSKILVHSSSSIRVYEVQVPISPMLVVKPGMSLGATALISWGHGEPFTGICATPPGISFGRDVAYLDALWWGYLRWTAINYITHIDQDLAYGLSGFKWHQTPHPCSGKQLPLKPE